MAENHAPTNDLTQHQESYRAFLKGVIVVILAGAYTLVALCAFAFGQSFSLLLGWAVLIFGLIAILIDLRSGSKTWRLSLGTLLVLGLLTAINIS
jgi:predicted membrane channel-forming protein YqfA (hemolysin III family)